MSTHAARLDKIALAHQHCQPAACDFQYLLGRLAPMPCGHPAACVGQMIHGDDDRADVCRWCVDVDRLTQERDRYKAQVFKDMEALSAAERAVLALKERGDRYKTALESIQVRTRDIGVEQTCAQALIGTKEPRDGE